MIPDNPPAEKVTGILTSVDHHRPNGETVTVMVFAGKRGVKLEFSYEEAREMQLYFLRAVRQIEHAREIRAERAAWGTRLSGITEIPENVVVQAHQRIYVRRIWTARTFPRMHEFFTGLELQDEFERCMRGCFKALRLGKRLALLLKARVVNPLKDV